MEEGAWADLKPWFHEAHWICEEYPSAQQFFTFKSCRNTSAEQYDDRLGDLLVQLKLMTEDKGC